MATKNPLMTLIFRALEVNRSQKKVTLQNVDAALPSPETVQEILRKAGHEVKMEQIAFARHAVITGFRSPSGLTRFALGERESAVIEGSIKRMMRGIDPPGTRHEIIQKITPTREPEPKGETGMPSKAELRKWVFDYARGKELPPLVMRHIRNAFGVGKKTKIEREIFEMVRSRKILNNAMQERNERERAQAAARMAEVRAKRGQGLKQMVEIHRDIPAYRGPRRRR